MSNIVLIGEFNTRYNSCLFYYMYNSNNEISSANLYFVHVIFFALYAVYDNTLQVSNMSKCTREHR